MAEYYMSETIQAIKTGLLASEYLKDNLVKTWKLGVFGSAVVFPALAILPVSESITKRLSDGQTISNRIFDLEIYTKGFPVERVEQENLKFVNYLEQAIRADDLWKWNDRAYDTQINTPITQLTPEGDEKSNSYVVSSILRIDVFTKNNAPSQIWKIIGTDTIIEPTLSVSSYLLQKLKNLLLKFKETYPTNALGIPEIKAIEKTNDVIRPVFPSIFLSEPKVRIIRGMRGMDINQYDFEISIITKIIPQDTTLLLHLDLTRRVKDLLTLYPYLSIASSPNCYAISQDVVVDDDLSEARIKEVRISDSTISSIIYDISPNKEFYEAKINFTVETRKPSWITLEDLGEITGIQPPSAVLGELGEDWNWNSYTTDGCITWDAVENATSYDILYTYTGSCVALEDAVSAETLENVLTPSYSIIHYNVEGISPNNERNFGYKIRAKRGTHIGEWSSTRLLRWTTTV
jgi:hypothetical protein